MWLIRVTFASHLIQISTSKYFKWGLSFFKISWKRFLGQNEQFLTRTEAQMGSSWTFVGVFQIFEQRNKKTAQRLPSALIALITFHSVRSACLSQLQDLRFASYKEGQKFFVILIFSLPWNFPKARVDGKNGHILPTGQWYAPSAVINDVLIMPEYARACQSMPE